MSTKLYDVLALLCDGEVHALDELQMETGLGREQTIAVVAFLTEFGFAETDEYEKVRISNSAKRLMGQIRIVDNLEP